MSLFVSSDTTAITFCPNFGSSTPTTRQSKTSSFRFMASSTSSGYIFSPAELMQLLPLPS